MEETVVLEWNFSPADYLEEETPLSWNGIPLEIAGGRIACKIPASMYDPAHRLRALLHDWIRDYFLGVETVSRKRFHLSDASVVRLRPDGKKDATIFAESISLKWEVGEVDLVARDKEGNIVSDTRRDRIQRKRKFGELAAKYRSQDKLAKSLLDSHHAAVKDQENELIHLYEVRDALATHFGGEGEARTALGISRAQWSTLGRLANDEPILQGRHRGKQIGELRNATSEELGEARTIAFAMISAYFEYLENKFNGKVPS